MSDLTLKGDSGCPLCQSYPKRLKHKVRVRRTSVEWSNGSTGIHWRPHIRTMLNQTSLLFEQNLPGTDRIELIPSKKALIIVQKSPYNGTILYPRFVVNDTEFYFLLLLLQHL